MYTPSISTDPQEWQFSFAVKRQLRVSSHNTSFLNIREFMHLLQWYKLRGVTNQDGSVSTIFHILQLQWPAPLIYQENVGKFSHH